MTELNAMLLSLFISIPLLAAYWHFQMRTVRAIREQRQAFDETISQFQFGDNGALEGMSQMREPIWRSSAPKQIDATAEVPMFLLRDKGQNN